MKLLLTGAFAFATLITFSQTVQSNGVVVHEALGIEGKVEVAPPSVTVVRTINDWSLAECIDAVQVLEMKKAEAPVEQRVIYDNQLSLINERIHALKSGEKQ